jgi:hypothetical protein
MIVTFRIAGDSYWYFTECDKGNNWNLAPFRDKLLGYFCGYASRESAADGDEDEGIWFTGKYVVAFREVE